MVFIKKDKSVINFYLHKFLCLVCIVLIFQIQRIVPLKEGMVESNMNICFIAYSCSQITCYNNKIAMAFLEVQQHSVQ